MRKLVYAILILALISNFAYGCGKKAPENGPVNTEKVQQDIENAEDQPEETPTDPTAVPDDAGDSAEDIGDAATEGGD